MERSGDKMEAKKQRVMHLHDFLLREFCLSAMKENLDYYFYDVVAELRCTRRVCA